MEMEKTVMELVGGSQVGNPLYAVPVYAGGIYNSDHQGFHSE
jgi:hypothetical protein